MPVLHVVVPFYNEEATLERSLRRVVGAPLPDGWTMRIYLVDDHSEAAAGAAAEQVARQLQDEGHVVALRRHVTNLGKGASLQTGFDAVLETVPDEHDLVVIQDADLEYDPAEFSELMVPILARSTNVVIGSRWGDHQPVTGLKRRVHAWGNGVLTGLSNLMTGYRLRDMECCYKMMTIGVLRKLRPRLTEQRFGVEPQIVAVLARLGEPMDEVAIRYEPRGMDAGKKIGWVDGVRAVYVIGRERLRGRSDRATTGSEPRP